MDVDCVPDHVRPVGVGHTTLGFYGHGELVDHTDGPFCDSIQVVIVGGAMLVVETALLPDFGEGLRNEPPLVIRAETTNLGSGEGSPFAVDFNSDGGIELRDDPEGG